MLSKSSLVKNKYQKLISEVIASRMCLIQLLNLRAKNKGVSLGETLAGPGIGALAQELGRTAGVLKQLNAKVSLGGVESYQDAESVLMAKRLIKNAKRYSITKDCMVFYYKPAARYAISGDPGFEHK
jgi:hypothetical protein